MLVIALEGCHGCGKTELVQAFANAGFATMDEAFMDMPSYCEALPAQSLLMETNWVCGWFQRVLQIKNSSSPSPPQVLVCDRSPLSAVFYTSNGQGSLLAPLIKAQVEELKQLAGIDIFTVHVRCSADVLWARIQHRLQDEPERAQYKEDQREWMDKVKLFYDTFDQWDFTVDNDQASVREVQRAILDVIENATTPINSSTSRKVILREANTKLARNLPPPAKRAAAA